MVEASASTNTESQKYSISVQTYDSSTPIVLSKAIAQFKTYFYEDDYENANALLVHIEDMVSKGLVDASEYENSSRDPELIY